MSIDWLWLPHTVTWQPKKNARRGGPANDGNADSAVAAADILVHVADPLTPPAALERYGIVTQDTAYLVIGKPADFEKISVGDTLMFGTKKLHVVRDPLVWTPGDGYDSAELIAEDQSPGVTR